MSLGQPRPIATAGFGLCVYCGSKAGVRPAYAALAQHLGTALCFGVRMMAAGLACVVHGVLPFLFVRTGSRAITELNERMITNRCRPQAIAGDKRLSL